MAVTIAAPGEQSQPGAPRARSGAPSLDFDTFLVAAFIVVIWLLPVQGLFLTPSVAGLEVKPDRVILVLIAARILATRHRPARVPRAVAVAAGLTAGWVLLSTAVNWPELVENDTARNAIRTGVQYALYVVAAIGAARLTDPRRASGLLYVMLGLAALAGLATLLEYATRFNVYLAFGQLFTPAGYILDPTSNEASGGRLASFGPTAHGLADATILAMMIPIALTVNVTRRRWPAGATRAITVIAVSALVIGGIATLRRTAILLPVVAVAAVAVVDRRRAPGAIVGLCIAATVAIAVAPTAVQSTVDSLQGKTQEARNSASGRTADYVAVQPLLEHHPILGGGLGSLPIRQRILDNSALGLALDIGYVGLGVYAALLLTVGWSLMRAPAVGSTRFGPVAAASLAVFAVSHALFDTLSFVHPAYVMAVIAGLVWAMAHREPPSPERPSVAAL